MTSKMFKQYQKFVEKCFHWIRLIFILTYYILKFTVETVQYFVVKPEKLFIYKSMETDNYDILLLVNFK